MARAMVDRETAKRILLRCALDSEKENRHEAAEAYRGCIFMLDELCATLTPPNEALPVLVNAETDREYIDYICPRCKEIISQRRRGQRMETVYQCKYHDNCGQCVDWSDPQPYRRSPEGEEDT